VIDAARHIIRPLLSAIVDKSIGTELGRSEITCGLLDYLISWSMARHPPISSHIARPEEGQIALN
jgi:hypothetical protein